MKLSTDRLHIRSFLPIDLKAYAAIVADPDVMRFLGGPQSADVARRYVDDCISRDATDGVSRYAVTLLSSGEFIGFCGFKILEFDDGGGWVDFGWRYAKAMWRRGIGLEAAQAVYRYGKQELGLEGIEARAHEANVASLRIIEHLGFRWLEDYASDHGHYRRFAEPSEPRAFE